MREGGRKGRTDGMMAGGRAGRNGKSERRDGGRRLENIKGTITWVVAIHSRRVRNQCTNQNVFANIFVCAEK